MVRFTNKLTCRLAKDIFPTIIQHKRFIYGFKSPEEKDLTPGEICDNILLDMRKTKYRPPLIVTELTYGQTTL